MPARQWLLLFWRGTAELDNRYAMETDDGALIEIVNYGFRHGPPEIIRAIAAGEAADPADYYMRTHARLADGVKMRLYAVE